MKITFPFVPAVFVLAFAFTIIGSSSNHNGLLVTGMVMWLAGSVLLFSCLVLLMWSRRKRYGT